MSFLAAGEHSYGIVGENGLINLKRRPGLPDLKAALAHQGRMVPRSRRPTMIPQYIKLDQ